MYVRCPSIPCMKLMLSLMTTRYLSAPFWLAIGLICTHCTTGVHSSWGFSVIWRKQPVLSALIASVILNIPLCWLSGVSVPVLDEDCESECRFAPLEFEFEFDASRVKGGSCCLVISRIFHLIKPTQMLFCTWDSKKGRIGYM